MVTVRANVCKEAERNGFSFEAAIDSGKRRVDHRAPYADRFCEALGVMSAHTTYLVFARSLTSVNVDDADRSAAQHAPARQGSWMVQLSDTPGTQESQN